MDDTPMSLPLTTGRRGFLAKAIFGMISFTCSHAARAHAPYRQWAVYRKKHLIIGTCRADSESYPFGKQLAVLLSEELPASKARVARAPDQQRLASLITTDQLEVILLTHNEGRQLYTGTPPFVDYGPFDVQVIFEFDAYLLLGSDSLPDYHAWIIALTLSQALDRPPLLSPDRISIPVHPGTLALAEGRTLAPVLPAPDTIGDEDHIH